MHPYSVSSFLQSNVQSLVGELMDVLPAAEPGSLFLLALSEYRARENLCVEVKSFMTTELILAGEKYADDRRWHVDTTLKILDMVNEHSEYRLRFGNHSSLGGRICS
jgi:hypothetical protein